MLGGVCDQYIFAFMLIIGAYSFFILFPPSKLMTVVTEVFDRKQKEHFPGFLSRSAQK